MQVGDNFKSLFNYLAFHIWFPELKADLGVKVRA